MQILGIFWRLLFWAWFTDFFGHTVPGIEYSKLNKPWQASVVAHVMRSLCSFFHSTWPHNLPTKLFLHWFLLLLLIRHLVLSNFEYMHVFFFPMFRACFRTWRVILWIDATGVSLGTWWEWHWGRLNFAYIAWMLRPGLFCWKKFCKTTP